jgi:hypothetical protein
MSRLTVVKDFLTITLSNAQEVLTKFSTDVVNDPQYAFTWADRAFAASGKVRVCQQTLLQIERLSVDHGNGVPHDEEILSHVLKGISNNILSDACYTPSSSSQSATMTEQAYRVARAEIYREIRYDV